MMTAEAEADEIRQGVLALLRKLSADLDCPPPRRAVPIEPAPKLTDPGQPLGEPLPHWKKAG